MDYVNLGQTGLKVSRICLGMMTYGTSQWRPWVLDEADARPIVQRAVELGVNFFDTADMYSAGASEELASQRGENNARIAYAWLLHQPGLAASIVGASKLAHIKEAVAATQVKLSPDEMELLGSSYKAHEVLGHT